MIEICAPAMMQGACRHSHASDQSVASAVLLRQEPDDEEEEDEDDGKDGDDEGDGDDDGYSE